MIASIHYRKSSRRLLLLVSSLAAPLAASTIAFPAAAASPSSSSSGAAQSSSIRTLDTPRQFPNITTRSEWETRARNIREQILVSCGLWPVPKRGAVHPVIFDKIDREGYSIEKVYFETV